MKATKLKLALFVLSILILTAFTYQGIQRITTLYVQNLRVITTGEFNGTSDFNGASTFDGAVDINGATTLDGAVTLGTVTAPVVGYATTGKRQFCATNTITDTATYTSLTTAVTTPLFAWCSLGAITADANDCGAEFGQTSNVTVTIKNSAVTPAANAAGAAVTWCVLGTP